MNVLVKELKSKLVSTSLWLLGLLVFLGWALVEYKALRQSGPALSSFMDSIPKILQVVFGLGDTDLSRVSGYMGIVGLYMFVLLSIHGLFLGISIINREQENKTTDFLLTKPISRNNLFDVKSLSGVIIIIIMNLILWLFTKFFAPIILDSSLEPFITHYGWAYLSIHLTMFSLGLLLAAVLKKKASQIGLMIVLIMYLFPVFIDLSGASSTFKKFSIYSLFNPKSLETTMPYVEVIILLMITCLFVIGARYRYKSRDL